MAQIGTRKLKIEIDSVEYTADVSNARFVPAAGGSDFTSFATAAGSADASEWTLQGTAAQDAAASSFWDKVFTNAGDDVPVTLMPYGNATPSAGEPHFTSTVTLALPDGDDFLGGEANSSTSARMTFNFSFPATAPVRVTS